MERIVLNGHNLTIKDLVKVARENAQVEIAQESRDEINRVREYIEEHWITEDAPPTYGFNTGLGKLKDFTISMEENDEFQKRAIFSHAACVRPFAGGSRARRYAGAHQCAVPGRFRPANENA